MIERELTDSEQAILEDWARALRMPSGDYLAIPSLAVVLESVAVERRAERHQRERGLDEQAARLGACCAIGVSPRPYAERIRNWYKRAVLSQPEMVTDDQVDWERPEERTPK